VSARGFALIELEEILTNCSSSLTVASMNLGTDRRQVLVQTWMNEIVDFLSSHCSPRDCGLNYEGRQMSSCDLASDSPAEANRLG
jgi:hypothetical protein